MNKITPHQLRDLNLTLPAGTECYLCLSVRQALSRYRKGRHSATFITKDHAIPLLAQKLGRGLKRFIIKDVRKLLPSRQIRDPEKFA
ncbi:MAG: hypothetical protein ABSB19_13130 [Methylomonas sp.]|jgi:hypothetical protein